ncbi:cardiotrophin-2-like [Scleropages formosus]|uniref:cardiotrophin-2-like n=1 Tax=Scleropages formosus TaxID=113540 RepID=UPI00087903B1|nr:cardiotrophin-2-like [Scleropages formosus]
MPMVCRLKFYLLLLFTLESCHITESHKHQHGDRRLSSSIHFTRRIRSRIQTLLMHYKEQELGDSKFEDRSLMLKTLPSLNTDYFTWLHMKDTERLNRALRDLNIFLIHLDANRKQIEEGMNGQTDTVTRSMYGVQLDVQDLLHHIKSQLNRMSSQGGPSGEMVTKQPLPLSLLQPQLSWHKRLQGYVVLRDLERYLGKLVRDFILLRSRYRK